MVLNKENLTLVESQYKSAQSSHATSLSIIDQYSKDGGDFKNNPLKFYYQLIKWKRIITNKPVRATMKVENEKVYLLKGKVNIQIKNNKVIIKDNSKYNIIPRRKIITSSIPGRNYQIIWDIYKSRVDNIKRARLYLIFWNNY